MAPRRSNRIAKAKANLSPAASHSATVGPSNAPAGVQKQRAGAARKGKGKAQAQATTHQAGSRSYQPGVTTNLDPLAEHDFDRITKTVCQ